MSLFFHQRPSIHYQVRGQREPLLLLHDLGGSGADFAPYVHAFESQFMLIVPDLPGCGHSGPLRPDCSIEKFAASLWLLLEHLEISTPSIVGFGLGGAVALEMALQRPDSVLRLALINSSASYEIKSRGGWLKRCIYAAIVRIFGMRLTGWVCAVWMFPLAWQRSLRRRAASAIGAASAASYLGIISLLEGWSATARLIELPGRTLVVAAENDITPLAERDELAMKLGAEFIVVSGSRHGTLLDATGIIHAIVFALMHDRPMPAIDLRVCDGGTRMPVARFIDGPAKQQMTRQ